jgi:hypothetical protein
LSRQKKDSQEILEDKGIGQTYLMQGQDHGIDITFLCLILSFISKLQILPCSKVGREIMWEYEY